MNPLDGVFQELRSQGRRVSHAHLRWLFARDRRQAGHFLFESFPRNWTSIGYAAVS